MRSSTVENAGRFPRRASFIASTVDFIRNQRFEGKRLFPGDPGEQQPHRIRHGETHCSQNGRSLFLDLAIDTGLYKLVCSHVVFSYCMTL